MADVARRNEAEEQNAEQPKKKGFNPSVLISIIVGIVIVTLIAFVIVFKMLAVSPEEKEEQKLDQEVYFGKLFSFEEPLIVNLAETKGQRYLKANIQFEVSDNKVLKELQMRTPLLLDLLISVLSSKTIEQVSNTVGRNRLRREIIDKTNAELVSGKIINVYFTEFVIQ
ncbi:MAG: flagellar basal body-associated FliL family protein [Candidatus Omnitrophica bacterium]|nr:flagellar basal body-associated FliL family protein [Candidatus Omnitrophota bacterium]